MQLVARTFTIVSRLQQLRYFLAVIDEGGLARAAQHLRRTQQAVSNALCLLEQEFGVRLLDRESGSPGPTLLHRELASFGGQEIQTAGPPRPTASVKE